MKLKILEDHANCGNDFLHEFHISFIINFLVDAIKIVQMYSISLHLLIVGCCFLDLLLGIIIQMNVDFTNFVIQSSHLFF